MMTLFLEIKKTKKHLYLHIRANNSTVYVVSTNRTFLRHFMPRFSNVSVETLLSHILSKKIKQYGFTKIYLKKNNVYHGCICNVKESLQKSGIVVM